MNQSQLQLLTANELSVYAHELDLAIENHAKWLANLNRTLIFDSPPNDADLSKHPHLLCQFGRWYHGLKNPILEEIPGFNEISGLHEQMHTTAKQLLLHLKNKEPIVESEYDRLIELTNELRRHICAVRFSLHSNINLNARMMGKVLENATEGVMITDTEGKIIHINKAFSKVTGYSLDEVVGNHPNLLYSGRQSGDFYRSMWLQLKEEGAWQGEIWNRRKNGEIYQEYLSITALKDEQDQTTHYVAIFSDITTEKENEERLYYLAHYDILTGLPNRMLFYDRLRQAISRAKREKHPVAVMFLDLDGFKEVNDNLGHNAGDMLLQQVADRLTSILRESDSISRFGGDEFTLVLPDLDREDNLPQIAEKIIEIVARPYQLGEHEARVTTSIGISIYPEDGVEADELITHADIAMYATKKSGKNGYRFYLAEK